MKNKDSKIKNSDTLIKNPLRKAAVEIMEAGLQAIDTKHAIKEGIKLENNHLFIKETSYALDKIKRIFVVGVGKCSLEAALALEDILGDKLTDGIVIDLVCNETPKKIKFCQGDHPFPTENNVDSTKKIIDLLENSEESDLIIFIISGGGSTLLCQPDNFTCFQESDMVSCLMGAGANIIEINTVRKHLSLARGGYLAKYAFPAKSISLIFSDVGSDMEFVASGPTIKDSSTIEDAKLVIEKYSANTACGFDINNLIETPKDDKYFENVKNILFLSNTTALNKMAEKASELGFDSEIKTNDLKGEAREIGEQIAKEINKAKINKVLICGGETTVTARKLGRGGRNQELVLSASRFINDDCLVAAINSDGWDNTDFAGALCDNLTIKRIRELNMDTSEFLAGNTSYNFFEKVGDYFRTGLTGSNVADLILAIKKNE
ncbi:MAG: DUF4147 domain-containing protein [Patescibacteria group bacterium]